MSFELTGQSHRLGMVVTWNGVCERCEGRLWERPWFIAACCSCACSIFFSVVEKDLKHGYNCVDGVEENLHRMIDWQVNVYALPRRNSSMQCLLCCYIVWQFLVMELEAKKSWKFFMQYTLSRNWCFPDLNFPGVKEKTASRFFSG